MVFGGWFGCDGDPPEALVCPFLLRVVRRRTYLSDRGRNLRFQIQVLATLNWNWRPFE